MDIKLFEDLTFKTLSYRKNLDMIQNNENIITEYEGTITKLRVEDKKLPKIIGEFELSVWDIRTCKLLGYNVHDLLTDYSGVDAYDELITIINDNNFDVYEYDKIVFIHSLFIKEEYRKMEITEEFVELLYRDYYNESTAIIALVKPFQNNYIDFDYFYNERIFVDKDYSTDVDNDNYVTMRHYYNFDKLIKKNDTELNEYKLFAMANKCGFNRLDDNTHLFILNPSKVIKRMINKNKIIKDN